MKKNKFLFTVFIIILLCIYNNVEIKEVQARDAENEKLVEEYDVNNSLVLDKLIEGNFSDVGDKKSYTYIPDEDKIYKLSLKTEKPCDVVLLNSRGDILIDEYLGNNFYCSLKKGETYQFELSLEGIPLYGNYSYSLLFEKTNHIEDELYVIENTVLKSINTFQEQPANMTIPDGVTEIKDVFQGIRNMPYSVTLPATLTENLRYGLSSCNTERYYVDGENPDYSAEDGILYNKSGTALVRYPNKGKETFVLNNKVSIIEADSCSGAGFKKIVLNNALKEIRDYAFSYCRDLENIVFSEGLTTIQDGAFSGCEKLDNLKLPDSLQAIGAFAFSECSISTVILPKELTSIEQSSFFGCKNMESVDVAEGNEYYHSNKGVLYTDDSIALYPYAKKGAYEIPENYSVDFALNYAGEITEVTFPKVLNDYDSAFSMHIGSTKLESIHVKAGNEYLESRDGVLYSTDELYNEMYKLIQYPMNRDGSNYTIPDDVSSIGDEAFCYSSGLNDVNLPSRRLKSVIVPKNVINFGDKVFYDPHGLIVKGNENSRIYEYCKENASYEHITWETLKEGSGDDTDQGSSESQTDKKYKENIIKSLPNMSNLGFATLKGPEISIVGNKFNLFQTDMKMSLPLWANVEVQVNESKKTVKVLIGTKGKGLNTENDDTYWTNTYKDVKSFVQKCGGTVDTTKLWNQFSNMRGKLKEFDANAVFKAKGNVAGYMELQMNDDGSIKNILEGGVAAGFNAGASVRAPLWWIVYSEFGIGGSVDGKLYLTSQNTKAITAKGEIGLAIKPSIALGADIAIADVKGGLEGTIAGKAAFPWKQFQESVNAYMTGKLFIKVDTAVPGLIGEFPYNFPKMELYPNLGKVTRDFSALQYSTPEPVGSQMVKKMSKNSQNAVDTTRESLVYENAKPEMTGLSDGRILMTYLDDTSGQAKLSYRFYDGGQWSESKTVWSGGHLDTAGYLYQYNGSAYVIFESSSQKITEDMTAEQIAGVMELYAAKLNGDGFEEPVKLGTSGTWKYAYQLAERDGTLCAVWAENSENDIMLRSGETVVYESSLNGTWQESSQISNIGQVLTEITSGTIGGTFVTAHIKDGQIYIKDQLLDISSIGEKADSLRIQNDMLYTRIDGMLCTYDGEQLKAKNVECTASYQIYGNTVYWIQQNNFKSEVLSQPLDSETNPVAVTDEGGYVGGFTMVQNAGGKPVFAYTYQPVNEVAEGNPYGATILKCTEDITRYQAEVTNVAYDILSFVPGKENPIHVTICNTGTEDLSQVQLVISDGDKVVYSGKVSESLKAGESKECEIAVQIPEDFSKANLSFTLTADQQFKKETTEKYELEYCDADIEVTENNTDKLAVKNNSHTVASNVTVILRDQNENGTEIRQISVGSLKSGESKMISIKEDWKKVSKSPESSEKYIYCEVIQDADEYELWNNSIVIKKQADEKPDTPSASDKPAQPSISKKIVKISKITLSGISKRIAAGKKVRLSVKVKPANATKKTITWKSSNKKVATVNSKGVVTIKKNSGGKSVTITAIAKDGSRKKAAYKITVMKGIVKKVAISGKKSVKAGETLKLKAKVTASKSANKKLKWTSSNKKYATVSSSGKVKALKVGKGKKVKITAMATDGSDKKNTVTIKIK